MSRNSAGTSSRWPTGTEYAASVQQPSTSFADPELRTGQLTLTALGIPESASGQSAIAFHMQATERPVAVRCLLSAHDDGRRRYKALQEHVEAYKVPSVVPAKWLDEGVRVHGRWWPVVIMPWVAGDPLHVAIEDRLGDPARLSRLADRWLDLVEILQDKEFAHGDYQHGNVLLTDADEFELVDLDGIWVPDMGVGPPDEIGHPNYQHVNRSDTDWGPHVDTFSALRDEANVVEPGSDIEIDFDGQLYAVNEFEVEAGEVYNVTASGETEVEVFVDGELGPLERRFGNDFEAEVDGVARVVTYSEIDRDRECGALGCLPSGEGGATLRIRRAGRQSLPFPTRIAGDFGPGDIRVFELEVDSRQQVLVDVAGEGIEWRIRNDFDVFVDVDTYDFAPGTYEMIVINTSGDDDTSYEISPTPA